MNHIFRPRTDLTIASYKRVFKAMDFEIIYGSRTPPEEEDRNIVIEYPQRMVSVYCEKGYFWDDPKDLSRGMKCPCICIEAGWDELYRQYIYYRFADVPKGLYIQGFKGGRKQDEGKECTPDFYLIVPSIPILGSPAELTKLWESAEPLTILERLNHEYNAYMGGKDYRQLAKESCKKKASFLRGDIYRINKEIIF